MHNMTLFNQPQRENDTRHKSRHVLVESPREHLHQFRQQKEAALSRLDALLSQLLVHSLNNRWNLRL